MGRVTGAKTWVEIDAGAYKANLDALRSLLNKDVAFCAVVKANAYGHDTATIVKLAKENGVELFGVDSIDEAIDVRRADADGSIFIVGYTVPERMKDVLTYRCVQTVYTEDMVRGLAQAAREARGTAQVNLKVETGTQRQGVSFRDLKHVLAAIEKEGEALELVGISSHFSSSELVDKPEITFEQCERFKEAVRETKQFGFTPKYEHISCSASTLVHSSTHENMVRVGLAQYGLWPAEEVKRSGEVGSHGLTLKPILSWRTRIAQVKDVSAGTPIGYDQAFVSDRPMRIAILPVGYHDGYLRNLKKKAHVLIKGQRCPVIGNICMNMCIVDVSAVGGVAQDDIATLVGIDGMNRITIEDLAGWLETIVYEVPTLIKPHLPRVVR